MSKRDWWSRRDADDDRDGWLDDFDFDDWGSARDDVGSLWGRYAVAPRDDVAKVVESLRVVQGFVDTFATGDRPYRVTFDESVGTAGTDFINRQVVISHKPLFDPTITTDEANTVLTAMACHEASHVRYGLKTAQAARKIKDPLAAMVSNILDDVRIERRFVRDYPGYSAIFAPAIAYVARSSDTVDTSAMNQKQLMIAGVRYSDHVVWNDQTDAERQWWASWAERWTRTDDVKDHVAGVQEGLDHLTDPREEPTEVGAVDGQVDGLPTCYADGIGQAADADGQTAPYTSEEAQRLVENDKARVSIDGSGYNDGEVYWAPGGVIRRKPEPPKAVRGASSAIRAAFARSRTGHFATDRGKRSGHLDSTSLSRIARDDYRIFSKRTAPSEGRYLVWLMVDCSGSMGGQPVEDATAVASSLAAASRHLPNVELDIWGWTSGWKGIGAWGAVRVWHTGDPLVNVGYLPVVRRGGTPDKEVVTWAAKAIRKSARRDQQPVLIIASDGAGSMYGDPSVVDEARRRGVRVVSVALGGALEEYQEMVYGPHGYVPWAGSIAATAKPLGELVARVAAGRC